MKILINYADEKYKRTQKFNSWTGKYIGKLDKVYSFGPEDIDKDFKKRNKYILDVKRGNGLWLWKPYFILKVMEECDEGDIIFYSDSGAFFLRNINTLIETIDSEKKIWVSDIPLLEVCFTKPSCFRNMNCDTDSYKYSNQIQATFFLTINCKETRAFVKRWLTLCCDYNLISPEEGQHNIEGTGRKFVSHREDQSILSLLCKKEMIFAHLDPTQRGKYPEWYKRYGNEFLVPYHTEKYSPILFLHKTPDVNIISCIKQYLICLNLKYKIF
ncbi:hypothetical protein [Paenibacillus koleovorans]|uniref:hypothetical protein n=1 Tax=Paenibacillus koleovorans TaxID=121608 RepID=UPI000FD93BEE|nr:hypothetical protein [Paenibacillus koleovorans]